MSLDGFLVGRVQQQLNKIIKAARHPEDNYYVPLSVGVIITIMIKKKEKKKLNYILYIMR